jgi:hypothetical protein
MSSHETQTAEMCLRMAEQATEPEKRRILLDLASKWLIKARRDADWHRVLVEVEALRRPY